MINNWLKGVAIAALTVAGAVAAQAADLPTRKEAPAPIFVPPPFTWTGFYIGLNAGGIITSGSRHVTLFVPVAGDFLNSSFPGRDRKRAERIHRRRSGWLQLADRRVRARRRNRLRRDDPEQDLQLRPAPPLAAAGLFLGDTLNVNAKASLDWLGTTRGKIGFVVTPDNRLMIYGTGGVAYGGGSAHFSVFDNNNGILFERQPQFHAGRLDDRRGRRIRDHQQRHDRRRISVRRPRQHQNHGEPELRRRVFPNTFASAKIDYNASIFRALVNYKF